MSTNTWQDNERQRRLNALHNLAETQQPTVSLAPRPPRRSRRRQLALVTLAAAVVIAAGVYGVARASNGLGRGSAQGSPTPSTISLTIETGLACTYPPAWSPHGDLYAVLGSTSPCVQASNAPASTLAIAIISATTGAVTRRIALAPYLATSSVQTCLSEGPNLPGCPQELLWSPDGTRIAASMLSLDAQGNPIGYAAFIISVDGSNGFVLLGPAIGATTEYTIFDLTKRTARDAEGTDLGAADSIQWGSDGMLELQRGVANAPVGHPAAGTAFSPWQPGILQVASPSYLVDYEADFGAWSPDGRYVSLNLDTHLQLPAATPPATPDTSQPVVVRAPRDAALTDIVNTLVAQASARAPSVAWDVSGAHLLEMDCATARAAELTVFSTAKGTVLVTAMLMLGNSATSCYQDNLAASWSPEGTSLLLATTTGGTLTRWAPKLSA